ncbi:hypothetical protein [Tenacibaculum jejuense]|uniref:Uncharacterized protein n=1 Tax=Tenacibaculum jejuense TaxID=584609 RepID=A0A238UBV1_9FLAO|nr:hypothetical protein [Tenacibaculum jejuense]SNR16535.1 protein of unknown function [Tenacibaculum jejuense]
MGRDKDLQDAFKHLVARDPETFIATVTKVDKETKTIEIVDTDGFDFDEVRLTSVIDDTNKVVQYPKEETSVLVTRIGGDENTLFVSAMSEVESIEGTIEETHFLIDKDGYTIEKGEDDVLLNISDDGYLIKKGNVRLKDIINEIQNQIGSLCDEVNKIVVSIGVTPNVAAITQIKTAVTDTLNTEIDKILKP